MRIAHGITRSYQDTGETVSNKEQPTGDWADLFDMDIPGGTDTLYPVTVTLAELQGLMFSVDGDMTVGTNGSVFSSPPTAADTINLKAGKVYVWTLDQDTLSTGVMKVKAPTVDITSIRVTNLSSPPVTRRLRIKTLRIK